jgi:hypothetical protein
MLVLFSWMPVLSQDPRSVRLSLIQSFSFLSQAFSPSGYLSFHHHLLLDLSPSGYL